MILIFVWCAYNLHIFTAPNTIGEEKILLVYNENKNTSLLMVFY